MSELQLLREILEENRDEIHEVAGVVGSAISTIGDDEVIEVYVRSQDLVYPTTRMITMLLGDVPCKVSVMATEPEAQADGQ